jgi:hypothetical protein
MMGLRPILCPSCGSEITRKQVGGRASEPFACPSCGTLLHISSFYFWVPPPAAGVLCLAVGYIFGLRGGTLLIFTAVLWFPLTAFLYGVLQFTFHPKIKEYAPDYLDLKPRI